MVENLGRKVTLIFALLGVSLLALAVGGFRLGLDLQGGTRLVYSVDFDKAVEDGKIRADEAQDRVQLLNEIIKIWRQRIDPQGVREVVMRTEGVDRIVIELPGSAAQVRKAVSGSLAEEIDLAADALLLAEEAALEDFPLNGALVEIGAERIRYGKRIGARLLELERGYRNTIPTAHPSQETVRLVSLDPWRELIESTGDLHFYIQAAALDLEGTDLTAEIEAARQWVRDNPTAPISDYNLQLQKREGSISRLRFYPMAQDEDNFDVPKDQRLEALIVEENPRWQFSGSELHSVYLSQDDTGFPAVGFQMEDRSQTDFADFTEEHIDQRMAIVIDGEIVTMPTIQSMLPGGGIINGGATGFTIEEVQGLITVLRSGSLRLQPKFEQEESVGATLGSEYVTRGFLSVALGMAMVLAFMLVYYRRLGVFAAISLLFNLTLLTGALAFLQATLTLPGVAGIILTVGMAVDANILIYERIREEALRGRKPMQAAKDGFGNALSTIVDANLTTLITGLILYKFGTGPVRGFATTLSIGILTSMFSALVVTRVLVHLQLERGIERFSMARFVHDTKIRFIALSKYAMTASTVAIVAGLGLYSTLDEEEKLGIDFLGGSTMTVRLEEPHTLVEIEDFVEAIGGVIGSSAEVKPIRTSGADQGGYTRFRITAKRLEAGTGNPAEDQQEDVLNEFRTAVEGALASLLQKGPIHELSVTDGAVGGVLYFDREHPEADLARELGELGVTTPSVVPVPGGAAAYRFEGTVDSSRTAQSLEDQLLAHFRSRADSRGVSLALATPVDEVNSVGAQVVAELRDKAIFAILLSLFAAVMYIRVRFAEYSFGFAAVAALTHDVLITLGALALADRFIPFIDTEINLPMIAAFLTIIGYSLNDTIVVFDRVRENLPRSKGSLAEIIDRSINQTLSRTLLTSVTTLFSVALLLGFNLGSGNVLEGFAFALLVGVIVGTYSSMFIASPILHWLESRRQRNLPADKDGTAPKGDSRGGKVEPAAAG